MKRPDPNAKTLPPDPLHRLKSGLVGVAAFSVLINLLMLTGPLFMLQIYDRVLTSKSIPTLVALACIAVLLYLFFGVFDLIRARLLVRISRAFDVDHAGKAFDTTVSVNNAASNGVTQAPIRELRIVRQFLASPAAASLFDVPWFPIYLAIVFLLHPVLGLLAMAGAVFLLCLAAFSEYISKGLAERSAKAEMGGNAILTEGMQQADSIEAMGMRADLHRVWRSQHDRQLDAGSKHSDGVGLSASVSRTLRLLLQSAILALGAYYVIGNELSPGALIAASIIFARALAPLDQAIAHWRMIAQTREAYRQLKLGLATAPVEISSIDLVKPSQSLNVQDLNIGPPGSAKNTVENVSFSLEAGDALAVMGESGGGKTTLVRGLLDLWPVTEGDVRLDGATLAQWSERKRGDVVGYAAQDGLLLPGTIAENIARFRPDKTSEELIEAARLANAHDLIVRLPDGYDTLVGRGGFALSGGQTQRILLARAIYRLPFLIVLDEPNSNLDANGERALAATVKALREAGSIVIVVTHRGLVRSHLNKLMLIERGQQMLFGNTDEVIAQLASRREQIAKGQLHAV